MINKIFACRWINFHLSPFTSKRCDGFTLVELLVVFSVIVFLSGIGFISFVSYSQEQALNQAALSMKLEIERAKANAMARVKPSNCGGQLKKYGIFINNPKKYYFIVGCSNNVSTVKYLPQNITFDLTVNGEFEGCGLNFYVLSGGVVFEACNQSADGNFANITLTGYGKTKILKIDKGGNVNIVDG